MYLRHYIYHIFHSTYWVLQYRRLKELYVLFNVMSSNPYFRYNTLRASPIQGQSLLNSTYSCMLTFHKTQEETKNVVSNLRSNQYIYTYKCISEKKYMMCTKHFSQEIKRLVKWFHTL
jgi:hypothetical protein